MLTKNQFITSLTMGYLVMISAGQMTWPTSVVELFKSKDTPLMRPMTLTETALLGSMSSISNMLASPLFAYMYDRIGRKATAMMCGVPLVVAWSLLAMTSRIELVLTALFVSGLMTGGMTLSTVFVSEIAAADVRGGLTTLTMSGYSMGVLLQYALGGYLPYRIVIYINLTMAVVFLGIVQITRESPIFMLKGKDEKGALAALSFYRGVPEEDKGLLEEFYDMKLFVNAAAGISPTPETASAMPELEKLQSGETFSPAPVVAKKMTPWMFLLRSRPSQRALVLCLMLISLATFMGQMAVMVYADTVFRRAVPNISSVVCNMMLAGSMLFSFAVSAGTSDKLGRKMQMIGSSVMCGVCTLLLATQLHRNWGPDWFSVLLTLIFIFVYNLGAGVSPYVILAEVFVPEVRALCTMLMLQWIGLVSFVLLFAFAPLVEAVTMHGVFYCFSTVCWAAVVYTYFAMPETKGLTPLEIQHFFTSRRERLLHKAQAIGLHRTTLQQI